MCPSGIALKKISYNCPPKIDSRFSPLDVLTVRFRTVLAPWIKKLLKRFFCLIRFWTNDCFPVTPNTSPRPHTGVESKPVCSLPQRKVLTAQQNQKVPENSPSLPWTGQQWTGDSEPEWSSIRIRTLWGGPLARTHCPWREYLSRGDYKSRRLL